MFRLQVGTIAAHKKPLPRMQASLPAHAFQDTCRDQASESIADDDPGHKQRHTDPKLRLFIPTTQVVDGTRKERSLGYTKTETGGKQSATGFDESSAPRCNGPDNHADGLSRY